MDGFNAVIYENDLKWPVWEDEWVSTNEQTIRTMRYLTERDVKIRGHVLLCQVEKTCPTTWRPI
jgi:endo-1,4-beta-xylanase